MKDISSKRISLRRASGTARLHCSLESLEALETGKLPKEGDPFETARAAAMIAAKRTPELLPHCHPIPIEAFKIDFRICRVSKEENYIEIEAMALCHARTGIEMEVLHALSTAALVLYDFLKALKDQSLSISGIRLLSKEKS